MVRLSALAEAITDTDRAVTKKTFTKVVVSSAMSWPYEELVQEDLMHSIWQQVVQAADRHYEMMV